MNESIDGTEMNGPGLDDSLEHADASVRPYVVLTGNNLGSTSLSACVPMYQFWEISEVANQKTLAESGLHSDEEVAQRPLDPKHASSLATYILKGLFHAVESRRPSEQPLPEKFVEMQKVLGKQPYLALQPLTANIRECKPGGKDLRHERGANGSVTVYLGQKHVLWVVDGQHRRYAMNLVFEFLRGVLQSYKYPKASIYPGVERGQEVTAEELKVWAQIYDAARTRCKVMVEVHLGLTAEQEKQLFHDLNNLTKRVEKNLAFQFDNSNPVNRFIKESLSDDGLVEIVDKDVVNWSHDTGALGRKDVIAINAILFLNKTNISGAKPAEVEARVGDALRVWEQIDKIPNFGIAGAKMATVAAQPVVLKAIAKLAYSFAFGREADRAVFERFLAGIPTVDFRHENPMWRYYLLPADERDVLCPKLKQYLPGEASMANRDLGTFNPQEGTMRFGAKHNDIFPILGDMIRWSLGLPSRHESGGAE